MFDPKPRVLGAFRGSWSDRSITFDITQLVSPAHNNYLTLIISHLCLIPQNTQIPVPASMMPILRCMPSSLQTGCHMLY